jgi:uncharacterized protein YcbX
VSGDLRVSLLSVTPIKGLGLHHPESVELTEGGVAGDRQLFLVDAAGELASCTDIGALMAHRAEVDAESGVLTVHGPGGPLRSAPLELGDAVDTDFYGLRTVTGRHVVGWDDVFSDIAGQPLRLVRGDTGAFDVAGVTLVGKASTAALAVTNGLQPVDGRRFRMNVEIAGSAPLDEDTWDGRELRLGDAAVRAGGPVKRCAATTRNPDTGEIDLQTLKLIGSLKGREEHAPWGAGFFFGVYADVLVPGRVSIGDPVTLL